MSAHQPQLIHAHDARGDEPTHADDGRKDKTLLHDEQPPDQAADDAYRRDAAPVAELNDREDATLGILPNSRDIGRYSDAGRPPPRSVCLGVDPLPYDERVNRLARALAVLMSVAVPADDDAARH